MSVVKPIGNQWEIDWSHPLSKGLVFFVVDGKELVGNKISSNNDVSLIAGSQAFNGTSSYLSLGDRDEFSLAQSGQQGTFFTDFLFKTSGEPIHLLSKQNEFACALQVDSGSNYPRLDLFGGNSGTAPSLAINTQYKLSYVWTAGVRQSIYVNDKLHHSATNGNTSGSTNENLNIGYYDFDNSSYLDGNIDTAVLWKRELSLEEIKSLHENPYQILKPVRTVQSLAYPALFSGCPVFAIGTKTPDHHNGTFTLNPDGTFTYDFDGTEGITQDTFTYTIEDANGVGFEQTATLNISAGVGGASISVGKTDLSLVSYTPITLVSDNQLIVLSKSDLTLTSYAPTALASDNQLIEVGKTDLALVSYASVATASDHQLIEIPKADLSLASYIPTINVGDNLSIEIPKTDLSLTGYAPVITASDHQNFNISKTDLTLTSYTPLIIVGDAQSVEVGKTNVTLTGYEPTVSVSEHQIFSIGKTDLTLTGYGLTVSVSDNKNIPIPKADLALTGFIPTINVSEHQIFSIGKTDLALSPYLPTISNGELITIDSRRVFSVSANDRSYASPSTNRNFNVSQQDRNYIIN